MIWCCYVKPCTGYSAIQELLLLLLSHIVPWGKSCICNGRQLQLLVLTQFPPLPPTPPTPPPPPPPQQTPDTPGQNNWNRLSRQFWFSFSSSFICLLLENETEKGRFPENIALRCPVKIGVLLNLFVCLHLASICIDWEPSTHVPGIPWTRTRKPIWGPVHGHAWGCQEDAVASDACPAPPQPPPQPDDTASCQSSARRCLPMASPSAWWSLAATYRF